MRELDVYGEQTEYRGGSSYRLQEHCDGVDLTIWTRDANHKLVQDVILIPEHMLVEVAAGLSGIQARRAASSPGRLAWYCEVTGSLRRCPGHRPDVDPSGALMARDCAGVLRLVACEADACPPPFNNSPQEHNDHGELPHLRAGDRDPCPTRSPSSGGD